MKNVLIVIPALDPEEALIGYCRGLIENDYGHILIVDDGSAKKYRHIFDELETTLGCVVLRHARNYGKGRALKDAFNYFLNINEDGKLSGVITVDSDGQHTIEDVNRMYEKLLEGGSALILGARDFDLPHVPRKSRMGNKITRFTFRFLHGLKLRDTQTGLRALTPDVAAEMLTIPGERFEYETSMLIVCSRKKIPVREILIETVYENNNKGTHFRAFKDSYIIYKLLLGTFLKYTVASLLSFGLDIAVFHFLLMTLKERSVLETSLIIGISTAVARIISSIFNFLVNKNVVFRGKGRGLFMLLKYYSLCITQMCASAGLVILFERLTEFPETWIKIVVDTVLFFISYQIQRIFVFADRPKKDNKG